MAGWIDEDSQTEKRLNRQWVPIRVGAPAYDVAQGGSVTADVKSVDGDDVVTSETTHLTVGASVTVAILHSVTLTNGTAARNAQVHIVPNGGSRLTANAVFSGTLYAGESVTIRGPWFLDPLDTLRSISSNASADEVALRGELTELSSGAPPGTALIVDDGDVLTTSPVAYYTCPSTNVQHANVVAITCANASGIDQSLYVAIVPSGQSDAGRRRVFSGTIYTGETIVIGGPESPFVLEPGDAVYANCGQNSAVGFRVSAVEYATT